jgi:hypothetical protein
MELASYLAGERWSDHPRCTHPLLAELARLTNDFTADEHRARLGRLVPAVIGLTGDDVRIDARIALQCAVRALPVVSSERQNVMAVSVLTADRVLATLDGRSRETLEPRSLEALRRAPQAAAWATRFVSSATISAKGFRRHAAPNTVRCAVRGVAQACLPCPDDVLYDMLAAAIDECTRLVERDTTQVVAPDQWAAACALTSR